MAFFPFIFFSFPYSFFFVPNLLSLFFFFSSIFHSLNYNRIFFSSFVPPFSAPSTVTVCPVLLPPSFFFLSFLYLLSSTHSFFFLPSLPVFPVFFSLSLLPPYLHIWLTTTKEGISLFPRSQTKSSPRRVKLPFAERNSSVSCFFAYYVLYHMVFFQDFKLLSLSCV
jgi:hypothetical protein